MTDVLVIGSGPGGVNAAVPLVDAGLRVVMLDYGNTDTRYAPLIPHRDFTDIRRGDPSQHRYFLGDRFEGIPFGPVKVGAQLTPPRMHILADAPQRIPVDSPAFAVSISLARGGLGAGWSAGVFPFTDDELADMGLGTADMQSHYDAVAARIGVAGERDDLLPFLPASPSLLPALDVDTGAESLLARYGRRRAALNADGFFLGRTRLAVCTRPYRDRGPEGYLDMAYWADLDRSIYRPQWTLEELQRAPNFTYLDRRFVERFSEDGDVVRVQATHADTGAAEVHEARALVMAAGTVGSTRLVLRALERYDTPVPILCNPYSYVPTVNLNTLGRPVRDRRHSLAQLTAMIRTTGERPRLLQAQVFSYRSLLTFKLMKESPLACPRSLAVLRLLMPHLAVLGINHEDRPTPDKTCTLRRGTPDRLEVRYRPTADETRTQRADERSVLRFFRRLGCLPLKTVRPGEGASLHYAGAFPMRPEGGDLTCDRDGRLRATRNVYLADGSVFPWIPPKGLTFNIMANADRVGTLLAKRLA
ncbi:MAG TPA: GMC oxidoreductase [Candidatus Binatia bacterium]|jgi:choline dehydrogenase-like flavoprotein|nr:GMC oxidoreductase [Candidatus Binatia bacterium]